jgi:capsular exopolysaccharide synthesis family protein
MIDFRHKRDSIKQQLEMHEQSFESKAESELELLKQEIHSLSLIRSQHQAFVAARSQASHQLEILEKKALGIQREQQRLNLQIDQLSSLLNAPPAFTVAQDARITGDTDIVRTLAVSGFAFLASLGAGLMSIFVLASLNPRLINKRFATQYLSIPTLCEIPNFICSNESKDHYYLPLPSEQRGHITQTSQLPSVISKETSRKRKRNYGADLAKEGFRELRTQLLLKYESLSKVIAVTSVERGEGKTTVAANLAASFAKANKRTLLVKADLEKPDGRPGMLGLSSYLKDEATLDQVIYGSGLKHLWITPSGSHPNQSSDLLSSNKFKSFLEVAAELFDHVIIDSAELSQRSDTLVTCKHADNTLLVVNNCSTDRRVVKEAISQIREYKGNVTGVILNNIPTRKADNPSAEQVLIAV